MGVSSGGTGAGQEVRDHVVCAGEVLAVEAVAGVGDEGREFPGKEVGS